MSLPVISNFTSVGVDVVNASGVVPVAAATFVNSSVANFASVDVENPRRAIALL